MTKMKMVMENDEDAYFDENMQMTENQKEKQEIITSLLEEIYGKTGFDLPYFYNGFEDNLYFMNRAPCIKVGLRPEEINRHSLLAVIDKLNQLNPM